MLDPTLDPIPAPAESCGDCLSRRTFLARAAVAGVAVFLAGCAAGSSTGPSGPLSVTVANFPALGSIGGIARVDGNSGTPIAAVRVAAAQYAAFSLVCPHQGATVRIDGSGFRCPQHGARFAADGTWAGGQPTSNLHALSAQFDAATGILTIS